MNLPKVLDAEKEIEYGYVFGVSGPGTMKVHVAVALIRYCVVVHAQCSCCFPMAAMVYTLPLSKHANKHTHVK